jgi:hypothetical protein
MKSGSRALVIAVICKIARYRIDRIRPVRVNTGGVKNKQANGISLDTPPWPKSTHIPDPRHQAIYGIVACVASNAASIHAVYDQVR